VDSALLLRNGEELMLWERQDSYCRLLHVSGRLRDPGQLYQGLLVEEIYQPRSDTSLGAHANRYTLRQCVH